MGEIPIQVSQDRNSDFEPQVVPKYKKNISEIEGKIIAMYARGMSVTQVSEQIKDIYGFEVSEGMVTAITNGSNFAKWQSQTVDKAKSAVSFLFQGTKTKRKTGDNVEYIQ